MLTFGLKEEVENAKLLWDNLKPNSGDLKGYF
jgi:hypothetical protein